MSDQLTDQSSVQPSNDGWELPLEELSDAVGRVDSRGRIEPCNRLMGDLLALVGVERYDELPAPFVAARGFRRVEHAGVTWVLAGGDRDGHGVRLQSARVRWLGELSGWMTHDLSNLLLSGIALADTLMPLAEKVEDQGLLDELDRGIRRGTAMSRVLANLLRNEPRQWRPRPVADLVDDAVAILRKHAAKQRIELEVEVATSASVCVPEAEVVQALLAGTIRGLQACRGRLRVDAREVTSALAGGRERPAVALGIVASPASPEVVARTLAAVGGSARPLADADAKTEGGNELFNARLIMARCGGELRATTTGDDLTLEYRLPTTSRSSDC
ncbi:MAG: hypothetical protein NXI31_14130 [bacterium]|nr:hypothetical protein [bacterium]